MATDLRPFLDLALSQPTTPALATELGADDILVFARHGDGFRVVGGAGRGNGWADIVEIRSDDEPLATRAWRSGLPVRVAGEASSKIVGPYWARHGIVVPLGQDHLVVFGAQDTLNVSDAVIVRAAAQAVAATHGVSAEKLLADELELVHALRALMAYRPENVTDTARHIALVATRALSCDVGAIHVRHGDGGTVAIRVDAAVAEDVRPARPGPDAAAFLDGATGRDGPLVEQAVAGDPRVWEEAVVSRMTLSIGSDPPLGALTLGHAASRPRGFTMLCQRIGRAIAESAELLLSQAIAREQLAAERDLLRRSSLTDSLTGVGNRAAWNEALQAALATRSTSFAVLSFDLDDLKSVNDRFGHATGDAVLRGAANALLTSIRDGDILTRVGGDEFLVLLPASDERGARRILRRVAANTRSWRVTEYSLEPAMSAGWAVSSEGPETVVDRADERMYSVKRRRSRVRVRSRLAALPSVRLARRATDRH